METDEVVTNVEDVSPVAVSEEAAASDPVPVEVVDADEVVRRIVDTVSEVMAAQAESEETPEPTPEPEDEDADPVAVLVEDMGHDETVQLLTSIQFEVSRHPMMTTDFQDYTVLEGLLLLLVLLFVLRWTFDL